MGEGLRGARDRVVLSSKTKVGARDTQEEMMAALEGSLRRLQTDYLDIYFNHAVNNVARLQNPEWRAFTERAKEQGKIRFAACPDTAAGLRNAWSTRSTTIWSTSCWSPTASARTPISTTACATPSISPCSRSCPAPSTRPRRSIGVVAMKTLMGARLNDMRPYEREGYTFAQAAFRWVLSSPRVDASSSR